MTTIDVGLNGKTLAQHANAWLTAKPKAREAIVEECAQQRARKKSNTRRWDNALKAMRAGDTERVKVYAKLTSWTDYQKANAKPAPAEAPAPEGAELTFAFMQKFVAMTKADQKKFLAAMGG